MSIESDRFRASSIRIACAMMLRHLFAVQMTATEDMTDLECADLSALCQAALCRGHGILSRVDGESGDKSPHSKSAYLLRYPRATNNSAFRIAAPAAPRIVLWQI